ncbi:hypothetical protein Hanom_Chr14g01290811 [Helianthus anomalus]
MFCVSVVCFTFPYFLFVSPPPPKFPFYLKNRKSWSRFPPVFLFLLLQRPRRTKSVLKLSNLWMMLILHPVPPTKLLDQNRATFPLSLARDSPLAPLFGEGYLTPFISDWENTPSTIIITRDVARVARDFISNVIPPAQRYTSSSLDSCIFEDHYCLAVCEGFTKGVGMFVRIKALEKENEDLIPRLTTSQSFVANLQSRVINAERLLADKEIFQGLGIFSGRGVVC